MVVPSVFIGIDAASSRKKLTYAALDLQLKPAAIRSGDLDDTLAFVGQHSQAVIAVHAPRRLNQGIITDPARRAQLALPIRRGRPAEMRVAEYLLRQHGLPTYKTPEEIGDAKPWMKTGFSLYQQLEQGSGWQVLEALPEVCFSAWLGKRPLPRSSLEGCLQRQLILYKLGLEIPDPMLFFQEVTRQRIYQGELPVDHLYSANQLSALALAAAAWQVISKPHEISLLGDSSEGNIVVPVNPLKASYR